MRLNIEVSQLLDRQVREWPLAAANYAALAHVETRQLSINGYDFTIQFNPARITSSFANTDPQAIQQRPCFLCHRPTEQESLPYTTQNGNGYLILCNPFPIFPRHFTIIDSTHTDQLIWGRIEDMLELAEQLIDFVLLYNGPRSGASAPDHFHFQAGNKGILPIQMLVESSASIERYPASTFVLESEETSSLAASFHLFYSILQKVVPQEPEPMLNILCWKTGSKYYLALFPRKLHRPTQYFAEGNSRILLSPGAVDLGGILITPLEKDFCKLTPSDIIDIFHQLSISSDTFNQIVNLFKE